MNDRIGTFATYYGCQPVIEPATESIKDALKNLGKRIKTWADAYNEEYYKQHNIKPQKREYHQPAKKPVNGIPYETFQKAAMDYRAKYGPSVLKIHEETVRAISDEIDALRKSSEYKDFPSVWIPNKSTYEDTNFDFLQFAPANSMSYIDLGLSIPPYAKDYLTDEGIENSYVPDDEEKDILKNVIGPKFYKYVAQIDRIIQKHGRDAMTKLKKLGLNPTELQYSHMIEEYTYEHVSIILQKPTFVE